MGRLILIFVLLVLVMTVSAQASRFEPQVIFEARDDERWGIYLADLGQLSVRPLLERTNGGRCAIVSPNRLYIIYNLRVDSPTEGEIPHLRYYVYHIETGTETLVADMAGWREGCHLGWSPNSEWINFDYRWDINSSDIATYIVRFDGASLTELSRLYLPYIAWSPQSNSLYIQEYSGTLIQLQLDTMETATLFDFDGNQYAWMSPDKTQIYHSTPHRDTISIDVYDLRTNQSSFIGEFEFGDLAFSSDSRRLAIVGIDAAYVREDDHLWQVVFDTPVQISDPVWSPDGNTLILEYHDHSGDQTLDNWLVSIDVEQDVFDELNFLRHGFNPVFVANGEWIVFYRRSAVREAQLYRMRPDGSELAPIPQSLITPYDSLIDDWGAYNVQAYFP